MTSSSWRDVDRRGSAVVALERGRCTVRAAPPSHKHGKSEVLYCKMKFIFLLIQF